MTNINNMQTSLWNDVNEELPEHYSQVLVCTPKGQAVSIFLDSDGVNEKLSSQGASMQQRDAPYYFCSQEVKGNIILEVTHWRFLPEPPY